MVSRLYQLRTLPLIFCLNEGIPLHSPCTHRINISFAMATIVSQIDSDVKLFREYESIRNGPKFGFGS